MCSWRSSRTSLTNNPSLAYSFSFSSSPSLLSLFPQASSSRVARPLAAALPLSFRRENSCFWEERITLAAPLSLSSYFSKTPNMRGSDLTVRPPTSPVFSPHKSHPRLLSHVPTSPPNRDLGWEPLKLTFLSLSLQPSLKSPLFRLPKT